MNKVWVSIIGVALGAISILSATSLRLKNDTKNTLVAEILAADGTMIAEETIPPFETEYWTYETALGGKPKSKKSITPMTIIWRNEKNEVYSTCYNLSSGVMVSPQQCRAKP